MFITPEKCRHPLLFLPIQKMLQYTEIKAVIIELELALQKSFANLMIYEYSELVIKRLWEANSLRQVD